MATSARESARAHADVVSPPQTDEDLVRAVLAGELRAFELLLRRYNQRLYRFARGLVGNDPDAREVVQEAYVRAYMNLAAFRGPDGFASWLYTITRNQALAVLRRRTREMPTDAEAMEHLLDETAACTESNPQALLERARLTQMLEAAVDGLPAPFRVVFVLRVVEGLSVRETAQVLDLNEKTVKTRLFRARRMLRARFDGYLSATAGQLYEFAGSRCDRLTADVMERIGGERA